MNIQFLKYIKFLLLGLLLLAGAKEGMGQENITIKAYTGEIGYEIDVVSLDQVFGTVTIDGVVRTTNYTVAPTTANNFTTLPTTVAGFGGVQAVMIEGIDFGTAIFSVAQANALIDYIKGGGIVIGALEGIRVNTSPTPVRALKYFSEALLCNSVTVTASAASQSLLAQATPQYHPGDGALLLNANGASAFGNTQSASFVTGLPCENIVFAESASVGSATAKAIDFVIPAFPGTPSSCGVNGLAIFSGEARGVFDTSRRNNGSNTALNTSSIQSHLNYARLMRDFLYRPSEMAARNNWSSISTNTNTLCTPQKYSACSFSPALSATTISSTCPVTTVDLTTITASNTPLNTTLTWHTATPATDANKIAAGDLATRPAGTYFAAFFDSINGCYSSAPTSVSALPSLCLSNSCPTSSTVDLEDFFQGTVPTDFVLTFHSGTPATDANKLSSSVVSSSGTYFGAFYLSARQCYTATGRPLVVTINVCTIVSTPSQIETVTGSTLAGKVPVLTSGKGGFTYSDGSSETACVAPTGFTSLTTAGGTVNGLDAATGEHTITAPTEPGNYFYCIKVCGSNGLCTVSIHKVVVTEACPAGTVAPVTKTKD